MDPATGIGFFAGIGVRVGLIMLDGGNFKAYYDVDAVIVFFGDATAATMIRFPFSVILHGLPIGMRFAFTMSASHPHELIDEITRLAEIARKSGPVALESVEISDPFLTQRLRYIADGHDQEFIRGPRRRRCRTASSRERESRRPGLPRASHDNKAQISERLRSSLSRTENLHQRFGSNLGHRHLQFVGAGLLAGLHHQDHRLAARAGRVGTDDLVDGDRSRLGQAEELPDLNLHAFGQGLGFGLRIAALAGLRLTEETEAHRAQLGRTSTPAAPSSAPKASRLPPLSQAKALMPLSRSAGRTSSSEPSVSRTSRMQPSS